MTAMALVTVLAEGGRLVTPDMCAQFEPYSAEWWLWACFLWMGYMRLLPILAAGVLAYGAAWLLRRRVA